MNGTRLDGSWNASTPAQPGPAGDVLSLIGEVERHLERIRQAQEAGAARAAAAEERFRTLERRECEVAERTEAIESARTLILGRERELSAEREMLTAMRDELSSRENTLRERALALRGEAERVERESAAARAMAEEADVRCRTLTAERDSLATERDMARSETERLRHDLSASNDRSTRLESRLTELESRGRALDAALVAKDAELATSRQALEAAVAKLTTLAAAVASYAPEVERVAASCPPGSTGPNVDLEPLRSRIAELEALLESARTERLGVESRMSPLHDRIGELESMLAAACSGRTETESQVHPLRERVADLESELARANLALEMARSAPAPEPAPAATHEAADTAVQREFALRLEEKGRRIAELAGFLRTRKQRLDRLHAMLKARGTSTATPAVPVGGSAARIAEETRLSDFRERLQAAAERLAETEERMVQRYAHARAPIVAAWAVIALTTLAALSWAVAGAIFPSPSVASCDLVAAVPAGGSLDPSQLAPWDSMCRSLVNDPATLAAVRDRFPERGLSDLPAESWMTGVRMDSTAPGVLRLTAAAANEASAIAALDTLASAVATASRTAPATVEGMPKVEIAGAATQPGQVTFSTARPVSDTGARIVRTTAIFSGLVAAAFAIGFLVHRSIVRSRRLLDDESIVA